MDRIHKTDCENIEYVEPSLIALLVQVWEIEIETVKMLLIIS